MGGARGISLLIITVACAAAAFLIPPMAQPQAYHNFADARAAFGIPNFQNVVSNLPFLIAGVWGLLLLMPGRSSFITRGEKLPYAVFFLGALLTSAGSAYYHLAPADDPLVWDRLPMTLGFAGLVSAALAERVNLRLGLRALFPLLVLGVGSVAYWTSSGNVIPYGVYQGWSILLIVFLIAFYPPARYDRGGLLIWAAVWYGLAKLFETFDPQIYRLLGETVSGHAIKHLLASMGVFAIAWQLRLRRPAQAAGILRP
jgi:hypothetical protein